MKQLLAGIAIIGVLFTTSFSKPVPSKNIHVPAHTKWKHTTWVNPWAGAKKMHAPKSNATNVQIDVYHECGSPWNVFKYRWYVNNNEYQGCGIPLGVSNHTAPAGTNFSIEMDVHMTSGMYYVQIEDYDGMGGSTILFYADSPAYMTFGFQLQAGHSYYVYTQTL